MSFAELRREYERHRIGVGLFDRVRMIVRQTAQRYPVTVYAETAGAWDDANLEALVQDFITSSLLGGGQLDYTMSIATTIRDFDRLTTRQVRKHLRDTRRRTVVDNLVDRARELLKADPFVPAGSGRFCLKDANGELRGPLPAEIAEAVRRAALIPREVGDVHERAPRIYGTQDLQRLVQAVAYAFRCAVSLDDVRHVLERLLTELAPSHLVSLSDDYSDPTDDPRPRVADIADAHALRDAGGGLMAVPELAPESAVLARDAAVRFAGSLNERDRVILRLKWAGASDAEAAAAVSLSRPTLANHKQRILAELERELEGLDESSQRRVMDDIGRWLVEREDHG